jgi:GlpG protein
LETFVAYLVTQNIAVHVDREEKPPKIWVKNEDDVTKAQQLLTQFTANPTDAEFSNAVEQATEIIRAEAKKRADAKKLVKSYSEQIRTGPTYRAPLTTALITLCVVLWMLQTFSADPNSPQTSSVQRMLQSTLYKVLSFTAIRPEAMREIVAQARAERTSDSVDSEGRRNPLAQYQDDIRLRAYNIQRWELWRLVTPIFIHFGVAHLLFNLLALFQLGRVLEHRYGSIFLIWTTVVIAAISNFLQAVAPARFGGSPIAMSPFDQWGLSLFGGISGVVFGLLGIVWMKSRFDRNAGFYLPRSAVIWGIAWILLGVSDLDEQLLGANMANWAHGAGFILGVIIGYLTTRGLGWRRGKST